MVVSISARPFLYQYVSYQVHGSSGSNRVDQSSSGASSFPGTSAATLDEIETEEPEFLQEAGDEQSAEVPQFGKQSLVKTRVRQYRKRKEAEVKAWSEMRDNILDRCVENEALPKGSICCYCSKSAECRCKDCGILKLMCVDCCTQVHQNYLHKPEIWKDDGFQMLEFDRGLWRKFSDSGCGQNGYVENITVINLSGIQVKVPVMFYYDEEHCLTLIEYGLWPATPKEPKVAFELHLLELAEVLFLECRLSTKQFCNALKWMVPDLCQAYVKDIYHLLVGECFSEFRFMRHQFRTLKQLNPELKDDATLCPACPRENGTLHFSVDALFGCVRKKSSGESVAPPKHGETFFVSQEKVDLFTTSYGKKDKKLENDCNQFQAGSNLRSKVKSNKLDETAVFGCACRHEVPNTFFSLKRGEQISNAVFLLKEIKKRTSERGLKLNFIYDIACTLASHLKGTGQAGLLDNVTLAIPMFHVYGLKVKCQLLYSPRRLKGFAMTDGEVMERLWSYLRPTGKITKEMTATNRIDALTDYLLHYTRRSRSQIGDLLCQRMQRTLETQKCSNEELKLLISKLGKDEAALENEVKAWAETEKTDILKKTPVSDTSSDACFLQYTEKFHEYYTTSLEHSNCVPNTSAWTTSLANINKLNTSLKKLEKGSERWTLDSPLFMEAKKNLERSKRKEQLERIHSLATERWFLLQLMKKYADGQSIAKKLCGQITKQTSMIKNAVKTYNANVQRSAGQKSMTCNIPTK